MKVLFPNLLPQLSREQYDGLKADIEKRGVKVPIEIDADTGQILDGATRLKICNELGMTQKDIPTIERRFSSENEKKEHVIRLNMLRRHMDVVAWGIAFKRLLEVRNVERKQGPKGISPTVGLIAEELSVPRSTAFRRLEWAEALESKPELLEKVQRGELSAKQAVAEIKKKRRQKKKEQERSMAARKGEEAKLQENIKFIHGDFRAKKISEAIGAESISLILTDPPYGKFATTLWTDLAIFAKRTLKPNGVLIVYSGQMHLAEVFSALSAHLTYYWTIAALHTHGQLRLWKYKVWNSWKPIIIWTNGKPKHEWFRDVVEAGSTETKDLHDWAQPTAQAKFLIESFSAINDLIVDPMCGSGTIPIAAYELGRRAIGVEQERRSYLIAKGRANADSSS